MLGCKSYKNFFGKLTNNTNNLIIQSLFFGPKSVSEIVTFTKIEQSNISHSLKGLSECGLVKSKKEGRYKIYFLNKKLINSLFRTVDKHAAMRCSHCRKK